MIVLQYQCVWYNSVSVSLKLLPHSLGVGVAYRGSSLVCCSVMYLEYNSARLVVYTIPLSHISDIRELAMEFFRVFREIYFKRYAQFMGKLMLPP